MHRSPTSLTASNKCSGPLDCNISYHRHPLSTFDPQSMRGSSKRKQREARPHDSTPPTFRQPVALHQRFSCEVPPHIAHSDAVSIRRLCEGSMSHTLPNWTCHSNPQGSRNSCPASLVQLLHPPSSDEFPRNIPLTRQSDMQRVVTIPIDRTEGRNAASCEVDLKRQALSFSKKQKVVKQPKSASFPEKLFAILEEPDLADVIAWTPRGTSWRVLKTYHLQEFVLPRYFRSERYTSFMRQVRTNPRNSAIC